MTDQEPIKTAGGTDITEKVQILYDMTITGMAWGSGLLDNEEMTHVIELAITMGWQVPDLEYHEDAMRTVAQQFPDHYEITTKESQWGSRQVIARK